MSSCSDSVGAVLAQSAACVTLSGVGADAATAVPVDSVVLDVVPSNCHAQMAGSLPRHAFTSSKTCVVVLCSRYSCSLVHRSSIGLHVLLATAAAVQRQHAGPNGGGGGAGGGSEGGVRGGRAGGGGDGGGLGGRVHWPEAQSHSPEQSVKHPFATRVALQSLLAGPQAPLENVLVVSPHV